MKNYKLHIDLTAILVFGSLFFAISTNAQQLEVLIDQALANNPEIRKLEMQYSIASEKINEVNAFPNTEIGAGYFISEPETRTGAQRIKVSVKQLLPWFGSITARENYMSSLADTQYEEIVIAKRKLIASVSQSYYNLYTIKAKQNILVENIGLLKTYETMALTSVEVGKASAVDVLRLQMRQNELDRLYQILEQDILAEKILINNLLNRDNATEVIITQDLIIPSEDTLFASENLQLHPELLKYDKLYQSVEKSELLNQKESNPMFGIGFDYIVVSERPDMNFNDNGKDIVMPMVTLSIPIFTRKFKSQSRQNEFRQEEIMSQKQERLNNLESALHKAIGNRNAARITFNTQSKNITQARNAEEILIKNYETGTIDFNDVLDIQELQLMYQMSQVESVKSFYIQMTIINYLSN
jgi:outer membrane protein TolC